jgi:ribonuclease R
MEDLSASLATLGFRPGDISNPKNLSAFIASIADHPLRAQAHTLILRSMKRALYSAEAMGHFGLAKHFYSHFTSPIRRYPDLILHRQLAAILDPQSGKAQPSQGYLRKMAVQCTEREQRADDAERALLEIKKYRYLKQALDEGTGEEFDAVVAKVTNFGLFVDLVDLQVGGLVHISSISRNYVRHDRFRDALCADGHTYALGDKVRVVVANVDFLQRKLDFALVRPAAEEVLGPKSRVLGPKSKGKSSEFKGKSSKQSRGTDTWNEKTQKTARKAKSPRSDSTRRKRRRGG